MEIVGKKHVFVLVSNAVQGSITKTVSSPGPMEAGSISKFFMI